MRILSAAAALLLALAPSLAQAQSVPYTFDAGVGLVDKTQLNADFANLVGRITAGGCALSGCTFTGPVNNTDPGGYQINGVPALVPVPGGIGSSTAISTDYATSGSGILNYNANQTILSPSVNTTNTWQNNWSHLVLNGPGQANGELNLYHGKFEVNLGGFATQAESSESSLVNSGTVNIYDAYLGLANNTATGTASQLIGLNTSLVNNNTAAGSVGTWVGHQCNVMTGAGTVPTNNYCLQNKDPNQAISTLGHIEIGSLTPNSALFFLGGPDNASGTFAIMAKSLAGTIVFSATDDGSGVFGARVTIGTAGTTPGTLSLVNATSGSIKIGTPTGALGSVTLTLPDVTDTLAVLGTSQTHTATQTFSGTANFSGVLQGNGVAGVSCAANTVTVLTEVVTNGIITHC